MITLNTKGYKLYICGVNIKGIYLILSNKEEFLAEFNSQFNKITNARYNVIEVLGIPLKCIKEPKEKCILAINDSNEWQITQEEYISLYD